MEKTVRATFFFEEEKEKVKDKNDIIIICYAFNNPQNVGAVLRLAANFNAKKVLVCDDDFQMRKRKIRSTATLAYDSQDWEIVTIEDAFAAIPSDYQILAIETSSEAENIFDFSFPEKCAIVLGNESYGLSEEALARCKKSIFIPMVGNVKSMNVSHALSVVLYENLRQKSL